MLDVRFVAHFSTTNNRINRLLYRLLITDDDLLEWIENSVHRGVQAETATFGHQPYTQEVPTHDRIHRLPGSEQIEREPFNDFCHIDQTRFGLRVTRLLPLLH